jgi:hypothetical protein
MSCIKKKKKKKRTSKQASKSDFMAELPKEVKSVIISWISPQSNHFQNSIDDTFAKLNI